MFKQNSNSTFSSTLQKSQPMQMQNFSKLLKKLQCENINIDQLRLLKAQHTYLQKLRGQRQKIQQLKNKYSQSEQNLSTCLDENRKQKMIINQFEQTIQMLKEQYQKERQQRINLENRSTDKWDQQKEKYRNKINQLTRENQELKRINKNKELLIMQLQQQAEQQIKQLKDNFNMERKKIVQEVEEKLRCSLNGRQESQNELQQLRNLVTRQNKALKSQNCKYEQLCQQNNRLSQACQHYQSELQNLTLTCQEYEQKLEEMSQTNEQMVNQLQQFATNTQNQQQMDELRRKMAEMTKGEIQRIEFIVNQFQ